MTPHLLVNSRPRVQATTGRIQPASRSRARSAARPLRCAGVLCLVNEVKVVRVHKDEERRRGPLVSEFRSHRQEVAHSCTLTSS